MCSLPANLQALLGNDPAQFNSVMTPYMQSSLGLTSMFRYAQLGFGATALSDMFLDFEPYAFLNSDVGAAVAGRPVLVNNPALDTLTYNQVSEPSCARPPSCVLRVWLTLCAAVCMCLDGCAREIVTQRHTCDCMWCCCCC